MNVTGEAEAHLNIPHTEMANRLALPPSTSCEITFSKEKIADPEYKCVPQARKRKNMKLGT
jgi:hypothetical protein